MALINAPIILMVFLILAPPFLFEVYLLYLVLFISVILLKNELCRIQKEAGLYRPRLYGVI